MLGNKLDKDLQVTKLFWKLGENIKASHSIQDSYNNFHLAIFSMMLLVQASEDDVVFPAM